MEEIVAPYSSQDLFLLKDFDEEFSDQLVSQAAEDPRPFSRKVDLWWVAVMIGATLDIKSPVPPRESLIKFHSGAILGREPWRVTALELLALSELGEKGLSKPSEVTSLAHQYAVTGLNWMRDKLQGATHPAVRLMTSLEEILVESSTPTKD